MQDLKLAFETLLNIYQNEAYASLTLSKGIKEAQNKAFVTKLIYGVLEYDIEFDYYISKLCQKRPNNKIVIILKMGMYQIDYMDSIPDYAAVSKCVDLTKEIGKKEVAGFVNATLKKFASTDIELPKDEIKALSIEYSVPEFIVREYIATFGKAKSLEIMEKTDFDYEHFRVNTQKYSMEELLKALITNNIYYILDNDNQDAIFAKNDKFMQDLYSAGKVTMQSKTSMLASRMMAPQDNEDILDLCSAPGGKAVYMAQISNAKITACDIHPHRIELIKSYINRMDAKNIDVVLNDALVVNDKFKNKFDRVLCDVPCSGLGVANKKPDIYLNMTRESIKDLPNIQYKILDNATKYLKNDGVGCIVYSTCTTLKQENQKVIERFLKVHSDFELVDEVQILPDGSGQDGFYIAKLMRKK